MSNSPKKDEIANAFMEYFLKFGMKKTIVDDVVKSLGMSKKTIYKYFKGGKEEALYFFYRKIADAHVNQLETELNTTSNMKDKLRFVIRQIYGISRPHVEANVANEEDYVVEAEIVGSAFKDAYQDMIEKIIIEGIESKEFKSVDVELTIQLIYGMILSSLLLVHKNHTRKVEDDVIEAILKILQ